MEKITLKLYEFYSLEAELNGVREQEIPGILREKLSIVTKYWLTDLAKKVVAERDAIETIKNDLIKKYGAPDDQGNVSIPVVIDEKDEEGNTKKVANPNYLTFQKEFTELLETEKEFEYKPLKLSDFESLETTSNYVTLFKLMQP